MKRDINSESTQTCTLIPDHDDDKKNHLNSNISCVDASQKCTSTSTCCSSTTKCSSHPPTCCSTTPTSSISMTSCSCSKNNQIPVKIADNNTMKIQFFILADTTYGSCCVDEVAANHANADLIVHYGRTCLSR